MTFSGGIIDLTLFGILQGNDKTNWIWIVIIGLIYAVVYYLVFYFMITKLNLKTPGREADDEETRFYIRADMTSVAGTPVSSAASSDPVSALILRGLGGKENISDVDCCATRLGITVKNPQLVDNAVLRQSGASGVIAKGVGIQVVYRPQVSVIKSKFEDFLSTPEADIINSSAVGPLTDIEDGSAAVSTPTDENESGSKNKKINSPITVFLLAAAGL